MTDIRKILNEDVREDLFRLYHIKGDKSISIMLKVYRRRYMLGAPNNRSAWDVYEDKKSLHFAPADQYVYHEGKLGWFDSKGEFNITSKKKHWFKLTPLGERALEYIKKVLPIPTDKDDLSRFDDEIIEFIRQGIP